MLAGGCAVPGAAHQAWYRSRSRTRTDCYAPRGSVGGRPQDLACIFEQQASGAYRCDRRPRANYAGVPACPLTVCAWWLGSLALDDLWERYVCLGGSAEPAEGGNYLRGSMGCPAARAAARSFRA